MTAPRLLSARAVRVVGGTDTASANHVTLDFDQAMSIPTLLDKLRFSFDGGLLAVGVEQIPAVTTRITLLTTTQILGREYSVSVSGAVQNSGLEYLNQDADTSTFLGYGAAADFVVQDLVARPNPTGGTIDLFWNDHSGGAPAKIIILRRPRSWMFEETDPGEIVYASGIGGIGTDILGVYDRHFEDTSTALEGGKFYYYTVGISLDIAAGFVEMAITSDSRTIGFCVEDLDSISWIRQGRIPRMMQDRDVEVSGFLSEPLDLMADWLTIMRSMAKASLRAGMWSEVANPALFGLNTSAGISPSEGDAYDFDTVRRALIRLFPLWGKKGRLDNLVDVVRILVGWECETQEFGVWERSRLFGTLDPDSRRSDGTISDLTDIDNYEIEDDGRTPWAVSEWVGARFLDGFGNWINITDNAARTLTVTPESVFDRRALTDVLPLAQQYVDIDDVFGILVGQRVQLRNPTTGRAEVIQVTDVQGSPKRLYFWNILEYTYDTDSYVSLQITQPTPHMRGEVSASAADSILVADGGGTLQWETNQWAGFILRDSGGTYRTVVSNTADTLAFDDGLTSPAGEFTLARSYSGTNVGIVHFWVYYGHTPRLYDPLFDNTLRGTRFDPYYYLYSGRSGRRSGQWGSCDLGVYILSADAAVVRSRWTSITENTLTDTSANWGADDLAGMYLNPNQNQTNLLQILSNTNNTITVAGRVDTVAVSGQAYFVITGRNAARYRTLVRRLPEFVADGVHPRVLFF